MQQPDDALRAQLRAQLAAVGLELDEARLSALLPIYAGIQSGVRQLASLDLGETEPAMVYEVSGIGSQVSGEASS